MGSKVRPDGRTPKAIRRARFASNHRGFSMIEVMVVIVLIAIIVTTFSSRLGRSNRQLRKDVRYFAGMMREVRTKARMKNLTYRLTINIPEDKDKPQNYWVESTSKKTLLDYSDKAMEEARREKKKDKDGKEPPDPAGFTKNEYFAKNGDKLPKGLFFKGVEVASQNKEYTSGRIFIHFFPEGRVEEAVVHLTDRDQLHWSLGIHPLTGRVDIIAGDKKLADFNQD